MKIVCRYRILTEVENAETDITYSNSSNNF